MGTSLDGRDDRHAYVGYVFQSLNAFVVNLAPNPGIGDIAERIYERGKTQFCILSESSAIGK
jgi:hypothetical protein